VLLARDRAPAVSGATTRRRVLGVALVLLVLSRLPFLVSHSDWGVFFMEHLWLLTDSAAIERWEDLTGRSDGSLAAVDQGLYEAHYHSGALWLTETIRTVGWLTGGYGLLQLKLVGLVASMLALVAYLVALFQVWPRQPLRWAVTVFVVWLAPPTLLLWLTLMPMGHYMETWFFHALFLPPLVLVCSDRAGPGSLAAIGVAVGLACTYVFSNVVFGVLLAGMFVLFSTRNLRGKALGLASLVGVSAATWLLIAGPRFQAALGRLEPDEGQQRTLASLFERVVANVGHLTSQAVVVNGDTWCRRGFFSVLEPSAGATGGTAAYALAVASGLGALFLLGHVALLLHPRRRAALGLPQRLLAAHGLLLMMTVTAYGLILDPKNGMAIVSYMTLSYAALMFGLSQGAAELVTRGPTWVRALGGVPVLGLLVLLGAGWSHSSQHALRDLDRPDIQRADFRRMGRIATMESMEGEGDIDPAAVQDFCDRAAPGNDAFCDVQGWISALPALGQRADATDEDKRMAVWASICAAAPSDQQEPCAKASGALRTGGPACDFRASGPGLGASCEAFPVHLRQACITGLHRGPVVQHNHFNRCAVREVLKLCGVGEPGVPVEWGGRACLEATAMMLTGMPPLPPRPDVRPTGACGAWPADWQGLCLQIGAARQAGPDETSCEDVYRSRFASSLPPADELILQQCAYAGALPIGWELYPSCVIGVARAQEGLQCSWRGDALRL